MMFDCRTGASVEAVLAASEAIAGGRLVVIPTDTVYGVAADAFSPSAVQRLLEAKGRGREMPPPVLVGAATTLEALVDQVPAWLRAMVEEFWPGPLTVICREQPSLTWDLGDTRGTVAVRMPDHPVAIEVLMRTGPLAVSSANVTGEPAATTAEAASAMLADAVDVYLDAGESQLAVPSTILDATASPPRVVRAGSIDLASLHRFNNTIVESDD